MKIKFKFPITDGEIKIENVDGQLRITIPGAPDHTINRLNIERSMDDDGFWISSHNDEVDTCIFDDAATTGDKKMKKIAYDLFHQIKAFDIDDAVWLPGGAIAVYPTEQWPDNTGWFLMPDSSTAVVEGIEIRDSDGIEFLNGDGECYSGDDAFNSWIEAHKSMNKK